MTEESIVWTGRTSQVVNLVAFVIGALLCLTVVGALFGLPLILWRYLAVRSKLYELTSQRLRIHSGILSRRLEDIELYRVKDTKFEQPFFQRLFGLGNVVLLSSDKSTPAIVIEAIPGARELKDRIRDIVELRRDTKRVRALEVE